MPGAGVRLGSVPACRGHLWIFNLATCYAGLTGRIRPKPAVHAARLGKVLAIKLVSGAPGDSSARDAGMSRAPSREYQIPVLCGMAFYYFRLLAGRLIELQLTLDSFVPIEGIWMNHRIGVKKMQWFAPVLLFVACAAPTASAEEQAYPAGWPQLLSTSASCKEIEGTYVDPNGYRINEPQDGWTTAKQGYLLAAAWEIFGFLDFDRLLLNDTRITSRAFALSVGADGTFAINYFAEGNLLSTKRIGRSKWSCDKEGLHATTLERTGVIADLIPNHGWSRRAVTLHRVGSELIASEMNESLVFYLKIIPIRRRELRWHRFPLVGTTARDKWRPL